jgi:catechol 2,3-dioxygenase-like lactoylglutathione lyase family enzyme
MEKLQTQGLHHVTLVGADRSTSIDFWEGVLGMPFVFEQPNLDNPNESHIYFDPGDGRLITVFTREDRKPLHRRTPTEPGCVHHIAFNVSRANFNEALKRLNARGIENTGLRDRQIFDAVYFQDPLGLLIELSCWKFEPPAGFSRSDVLHEAHHIRVARGDRAIMESHLADAIELLVQRSTRSLSADRSPKDPYGRD